MYEINPIIAKCLVAGAASRRDSRRGSFRLLLTPLTYIPVGNGAPAVLIQNLTGGELQDQNEIVRSSCKSRGETNIQHRMTC